MTGWVQRDACTVFEVDFSCLGILTSRHLIRWFSTDQLIALQTNSSLSLRHFQLETVFLPTPPQNLTGILWSRCEPVALQETTETLPLSSRYQGFARPGGHRRHGLHVCPCERRGTAQARGLPDRRQARAAAAVGKRQQGKARLAASRGGAVCQCLAGDTAY